MSVTIDRCGIRGSREAVERARRQLLQTHWPPIPDSQIVILRRLEAHAALPELPRRIYREADRLIAARVGGWSEDALYVDCVYFRSDAEMLARLSLDLALGRAAGVWFWQSFRCYSGGGPGTGLSALWQPRISRLPSVFRVLRERGLAAPVWSAIDESQARALLPALLSASLLHALRAAPEPSASAGGQLPMTSGQAVEPGSIIDQLEPRVRGAPPSNKRLLALALVIAVERPHWLLTPRGESMVLALVREPPSEAPATRPRPDSSSAIAPDRPVEADEPIPASEGAPVDAGPQRPHEGAALPSAKDRRHRQVLSESPPDDLTTEVGSGVDGPARASDHAKPMLSKPGYRKATRAVQPLHEPPADRAVPTPVEPITTEPALPQWRVEQGGLFYLLTLLNLVPVRKLLLADEQAMAFPSGWGWLYRLGEAMGLQAERSLVRCLAYLAGFEEDEFPRAFPELAAAEEILAYGRERYERYGIWQPSLLRIPAAVSYRRPELDIDYRMGDLDNQVRMAALDIDPGWVDWLGTLVRFHYRDRI